MSCVGCPYYREVQMAPRPWDPNDRPQYGHSPGKECYGCPEFENFRDQNPEFARLRDQEIQVAPRREPDDPGQMSLDLK